MGTFDRKSWEKSKRTKYAKQYKARHRANEVYKVAQICSLDGCGKIGERHHPDYDKPEEIVWLCLGHHRRVHFPNTHCSAEGCSRPHHSKGRCKLHYNRWMRENKEYYLKELARNRQNRKKK